MDPATGTVRHLELPELAPGDPPLRVVRRGDVLVAWAYRTLILEPGDDWESRVLASDSLIFIPSSAPDRVWVGIADEARSDSGSQRRKENAVAEQVVAPVPVVVPQQEAMRREQVRAKGLGGEVGARGLDDQVDEREDCGRDHPEGQLMPGAS